MKTIFNSAFKATAALAVAACAFTACDNDKIYTTDFEETFIPKEIILNVTPELPLPVGMDTTLTYSVVAPEGADPSVRFLTSDENIVAVTPDGTLHGVAVGEATITCTLPVGFGPSATVYVKVVPELIKAQSITVVNNTPLGEDGQIFVTDELQLSAVIAPENHTYDRVVWTSSNESLATVDETGLVKCVGDGNVTITATATDRSGVRGSIDFKIEKFIEVESIAIKPLDGPISIVGGSVELDVTYGPENGTKGSVAWESSDASVATVHRGVVTPVGFGTATITGTCPNGEKASVAVQVLDGWYVWNAANQFIGTGDYNTWAPANKDQADYKIVDGKWRIWFPDAGTGKWRRDIKIYCSGNAMFPMHSSLPVLALRCTIQRGGNNTWDVRDSGNPKCNDGFDLPDGTRLIWIDLTDKFKDWGSGFHDFNLFQLKVADIPNGNVDKNAPYYDIYWIRTFASLAEAQAFATEDAQANPMK